jgi:hypothetical protein
MNPRRLAAFFLPCALLSAQPVVKNRPPLAPDAFYLLPLGSVKPHGWLKRQLEIQAAGQSGKLDEFWPSLTADSGWLGGPGESWERGPYWLDGLVPLAWLLDDLALKQKAQKWLNWTLDNQRSDGAIGPARNTDWWPNFVIHKALLQYQEATADPRVIPLLERYFAYMARSIEARPLQQWAIYRWGDQAYALAWLYNRTGNKALLELAATLGKQGYDWKGHFADFQYPGKVTREQVSLKSHVVNNAMALKTPGVWSWFSANRSDREATNNILAVMDRHHLLPNGIHSGDEHYAGRSPVQGTELCAIVEAMFSLELLTAIHGDPALADRLEKLAYNGLPGTFDDAMWAHQYDQQPNQVLATVHRRDWTTNGPESNLFGLEPNFGCCTANFHQGWPKFAANLWMATADDGLAAVAYAPARVSAPAGGGRVDLAVETEYPFRETVRIRVTGGGGSFPLMLRIPGWAEGATVAVNGRAEAAVRPGTFHRLARRWAAGDRIELRFPMKVRLSRWYNQSIALDRGPLVFSLRVPTDWRKLRDRGPTADWTLHPAGAWNYGLAVDESNLAAVRVEEAPLGAYPFSAEGAPVRLTAPARRIPGWEIVNGSAAPPPEQPASTQPLESVTLVPYGAAKLRITAFPQVAK